MADERISAAEAAARLGVQRATLYAYVSRGLLESRTLDGKTSTFDPREVERLQGRRRGARAAAVGAPVVSAITRIADGHIWYRTTPLEQLVADGTRFETVAELLWRRAALFDDPLVWRADATVLHGARTMQRTFPDTAPSLDRLRATVAYASACDPLRHDLQPRSIVRNAASLMALLVDAMPGAEHRSATAALADRLWPALTDARPTTKWRAALNAALVVLADHDLAASTFAVRVAASARADVYSMVSAGLGPFGGVLHGAASRGLHATFVRAIDEGPTAAVAPLLRDTGVVGGFGHPLYPAGDPRVGLLLPLVLDAAGSTRRSARVLDTIDLLRDRLQAEPNVDCALAAMSALAGMHAEVGTVFAVARTAGWVAHGLAELEEQPLRFRPVSRWVG
jgi:citrate synthase